MLLYCCCLFVGLSHCGSRLFVSPPTALRLSRVKQVSSLRDEATRPKKEPAKVGKKLVLWMENKKNPAIADGIPGWDL